jgi:hypothetical protein
MSLDLDNLLKGWPHEPGQIKVRKILGDDGREKLQLRIDLGLIQMNCEGRPDGERPHGFDSLLEYHKNEARKKDAEGERYQLSVEDVGELQQEGIQYYHRYVSLFQLDDYQGVIRDTRRNLELCSFVAKHVDREDLAWSLQQFRPYVIMMKTRAEASIDLDEDNFTSAVERIEKGRAEIEEFLAASPNPEAVENSQEIAFLDEWLQEVRDRKPLTKLERLEKEMEMAIAAEAYERAAQLRDAIREYRETHPAG